jgi:hypothetical protein
VGSTCYAADAWRQPILLRSEQQTITSRVPLAVTKDTSLVWRETANEDLCLAVACGCWVAEYCQRLLAVAL